MSQYNRVAPGLTEQFRQVTPNRVSVNGDINDDFTHDKMPIYGKACPGVVIEATSTEEVAAMMKLCYGNNIPVTLRGAGAGLTGDAVALCDGVILSTTKMSKTLDYDKENLSVRVQPGVLLNDLTEDAIRQGLLCPPSPGEEFTTLDGNVADNAGGTHTVKYGTIRGYVRAMTVVLPTGEIVHLSANVSRGSSGYSLLHLMIDSEGTLGIITELTLKLIPQPKEVINLIVLFEDLEECIAAVSQIMLAHLQPQALEFMEHGIVISSEAYLGKSVFSQGSKGSQVSTYLLIAFDGENADQLDGIIEKASEVVLEAGALDVLVADTPALKRDTWAAHSSFLEATEAQTKLLDECDVVTPTNRVAEYLAYIKSIEADYGPEIKSFGHAGDDNLYIYTCSNNTGLGGFKSQVHDFMKKAYAKTAEFGGLISGEHSIDHGKQTYLSEVAGPVSMRLVKEIKSVFGPRAILSPGKVCLKL